MYYQAQSFDGLFDFFSSSKPTRADNIKAGYAWLKSIFDRLRPNATYEKFIIALKQDGYGSLISDKDFEDFVETVGANYHISKDLAEKVASSLIASLSSNKNMLPTRKSIMSAFLNPSVMKWTYWDAVKVTSTQAAKATVATASAISEGVSTGANIIAFVAKYRYHLLALAALGVGVFIYKNRDEVKSRLNEGGMRALGLRKNPEKKKRPSLKKNKFKGWPTDSEGYTDYKWYGVGQDGRIHSGWTYKEDALEGKADDPAIVKIVSHLRVDKAALKRFNDSCGYTGNRPPKDDE